ncbi:MAG: class I SAM-dependent methyltransferase [Elusimicrobia bacterium]|nr:class I SAM-dependent methyltransferase [Elusimicrobiota bacterium]
MLTSYALDFNKLAEVVLAYRSSKPLLVALHYDLFSHIARGKDTPSLLGRGLGLDRRALTVLLDALAALGFLSKSNGAYRNSRLASRFLVDSSPDYMGSNLRYQELTWDAWSDLRFVLKTGKPRRTLLDWIQQGFFTPDYVKAMGDVAREPARDLARRLDWTGVTRALDIGCGAGTYSAAFVERAPRLSVVLLDLPSTLKVTRGLLKAHRHGRRLSFRPADYLTESLGDGEFDLALLSNVTHVEDEKTNRRLVAKAVRALKPGGRLVIHDFVVNEDRTGPRFPALLGLHLLLFTGKGAVYTVKDYAGWMRAAGLGRVVSMPIARQSLHPSTAVVGVKPRP